MKTVAVHDQARLGPLRCLDFSISSMSYRLFRSAITVMILALAVAFLAHVLTHSLIEHRTRSHATLELKANRISNWWLNRLNSVESTTIIQAALANHDPDRLLEYHAWSGADDQVIEVHARTAQNLAAFDRYLRELPEAQRAVLTGGHDPIAAIRHMGAPGRLEQLMRHMDELRLPPPPGGYEAFRQMVSVDQQPLERFIEKIQVGQGEAVSQLDRDTGNSTVRDMLAHMPERMEELLDDAGFRVPKPDLQRLAILARQDLDMDHLAIMLADEKVKQALIRRMNAEPAEIHFGLVLDWLDHPEKATWLAGELASAHAEYTATDLSAARLESLAQSYRREQRLLTAVGGHMPTVPSRRSTFSSRTTWLIVLSFLVCAVGVTNAMFMSVTERFREIATMKCLGALDGFLLLVFLIESTLQGLVGAVAGIVIGVTAALIRGLSDFGTLVFETLPIPGLLACSVVSLIAGVMLAVVSAVGPAWMAARLIPMEAMRIE